MVCAARDILIFRYPDHRKIQSLGIIYEVYETPEHLMHQIFTVSSSKLLVAKYTFCMAADFKSVTMPNINSSTDALNQVSDLS